MAAASEAGGFEVMEVDDNSSLAIFAEDQEIDNDFCLDIDLTEYKPNQELQPNNQNVNLDNLSIPSARKSSSKSSRIEVVVRKRPMNSKELDNGETDIGQVHGAESITLCEPRLKVDLTKYTQHHDFTFDHCFDEHASNKDIYKLFVKPLFNTILRAGNGSKYAGKATCFGYGQTGSGKTYTLLGSTDSKTGQFIEGLYAMAVRDLFKYLPLNNEIMVSFYEIYGGKLFDLLANRKQILCREDGKQKVNIIGLKRVKCENVDFLMRVIADGNAMRQTGSTGANNASSRSHAILSMDVEPIGGRLSFIDLAGSERGADTQNNNKQTRMEGAEINRSLLALKECIRALDQKASHKPFRGSKLTQVLKESFIGNSRTLMIANISPNSGSCENTLNTLRYAYRVKELKSQASVTPVQRSMARNRSEPNLETQKSGSRPYTAKRRNKLANHDSNRKYVNNAKEKKSIAPTRDRHSNNEHLLRRIKRRRVHTRKQDVESQSQAQRQSPRKQQSEEPESHVVEAASGSASNNSSIIQPKTSLQSKKTDPKPANDEGFKESLTKKHLIKAHRKHIDEFMILIKEDMQLLKSFDKDEVDHNLYQQKLRAVLDRQSSAIQKYKSRVFK